jgi:hypothetical protein
VNIHWGGIDEGSADLLRSPWDERLGVGLIAGSVAAWCWTRTVKIAFKAFSGPLAIFLSLAERWCFRRALILLGTLCFLGSKALSLVSFD